jgi:hypothetical protein
MNIEERLLKLSDRKMDEWNNAAVKQVEKVLDNRYDVALYERHSIKDAAGEEFNFGMSKLGSMFADFDISVSRDWTREKFEKMLRTQMKEREILLGISYRKEEYNRLQDMLQESLRTPYVDRPPSMLTKICSKAIRMFSAVSSVNSVYAGLNQK